MGKTGSPWSKSECLLAIWAYDQIDRRPDTNRAALFREVAQMIGRSNKAVEYKVQNVAACDDRPHDLKPISEMPNVQALLRSLFHEYWANKGVLQDAYDDVKGHVIYRLENADQSRVREAPEPYLVEEGGIGAATARRERSQVLADEARRQFRGKAPDGKLRCAVCSVSHDGIVSDHEVIEIHHLVPVADAASSGRSSRLEDALKMVMPLCPTCHEVVHSAQPPLSLEAARALVMGAEAAKKRGRR